MVLVVGPTAAGKSAIAERLARDLGGEIVSADALQVYRDLDVGTAKPSPEMRAEIRHHCIDILEPTQRCTAGSYARCARAAIGDIEARGRVPVLAGGSGFYVSATLQGLDRLPRTDRRWRHALQELARRHGAGEAGRWLRALDPDWAAGIGAGDVQRLVRALEVVLRTGRPLHRQPGPEAPSLTVVAAVGVDWPRQELYTRIEERVDRMLEAGWLDEVRGLLSAGLDPEAHALQAIGYRELARVVAGQLALAEAREEIVRVTRRYAKRQLSWFRRDPTIRWFRATERRVGGGTAQVAGRIVEYVREALGEARATAAATSGLLEFDG